MKVPQWFLFVKISLHILANFDLKCGFSFNVFIKLWYSRNNAKDHIKEQSINYIFYYYHYYKGHISETKNGVIVKFYVKFVFYNNQQHNDSRLVRTTRNTWYLLQTIFQTDGQSRPFILHTDLFNEDSKNNTHETLYNTSTYFTCKLGLLSLCCWLL
jgi:hypothetical protein